MAGAEANADGLLGLAAHGKGRIAVFGDSGCLDSSHQRSPCYNMLQALLAWVATVGAPSPSPLPRACMHGSVPRHSRCRSQAASSRGRQNWSLFARV